MDIVDFVKQKVAEEGTQTAVARRTGVSQSTITKICSGDTKPELETVYKISSAYNLPLDYFQTSNIIDIAATTPAPTAYRPPMSPVTVTISSQPDDEDKDAQIRALKELLRQEMYDKEVERREKEALKVQLNERIAAEHRLAESERLATIAKEAAEKEETGELPADEQKRQQQVVEPEDIHNIKSSDTTIQTFKQS